MLQKMIQINFINMKYMILIEGIIEILNRIGYKLKGYIKMVISGVKNL